MTRLLALFLLACHPRVPLADACSPTQGLVAPVSACSADDPCTNLLGTYALAGISELTTPSDPARCHTRFATPQMLMGCVRGGRGSYNDDDPSRTWSDPDGTQRTWCEARPTSSTPRPLLIYVPGSGGGAGDVYDYTLLRAKSQSYDLGGGPGFVLVSSQPRNLHWPTEDPEDGTKHDSYHRDLATNRDVAFFDYLIDSLVAEGVVDPHRIYLTGWSNGARFATFYGMARHEAATAGGNRVAAVAVYSGGDPYENITATQTPSCKADPYPASTLPFFDITRNCDLIACDQAQYDALLGGGAKMTPGSQATAWIADLQAKSHDTQAGWMRIGYAGTVTTSCLPFGGSATSCTYEMAKRNHFCWPDGVADGGGIDHEIDLLDFLKAHPL